MKNYKKQIGDGKFPNKYWVFQYDVKFKRVKNEEFTEIVPINEVFETSNSLIGECKTFQEALKLVDNKAYLPYVVIEDRLTGQVFEQQCIVCQECNKEEYNNFKDIGFTKQKMEEKGYYFI